MRASQRILFLVPLGLFLASAIVGALISYNGNLALARFIAISLGITVYVFFAIFPEHLDPNNFSLIRVMLALGPLLLILYFVLTNDWTARIGKVAWLDPILRWFATWQPRVSGFTLDSNSLGGTLAMLIPLQVLALEWKLGTKRIFSATVVIISLLGLVVSASRSAWIAFGVVICSFGIWILLARAISGWRTHLERGKQIAIWIVLVAFLVLSIGIVLTLTPLGTVLLKAGGGHWAVARNSFDLASDYPFTGIGLGGFTMAYSSYVLLIHVPHTIHAHNLFLDIWLEQGVLGLMAFTGFIVVGVLNVSGSRWHVAAFASIAIVLIHGCLDDVFYGYGGNALAFLFVPLGLLARTSTALPIRFSRWFILSFAAVIVAIVLLAMVIPATRAMVHGNLGALEQTRAELSVYHWPRWEIQDDLRRSAQIDLNQAIGQYKTALELDPANVTANRRLAQIELSRGDYGSARRHLENAFAINSEQRATRQMLGESYAIDGQLAKAEALWITIDTSENQIDIREWWYDHIGEPDRARRLHQALSEMSQ